MNISQEKEHLYKLMGALLEERRLISEELLEIRIRINKLNDFQEIGISDIPAIDYIRLRNSLGAVKYENTRDDVKAKHDAYKNSIEKAPEQTEWNDITPEIEKEVSPIIANDKLNSKKKKAPSFERAMSTVIQMLKNAGQPLDTKEIRARLEEELDYVYNGNGFSTVMWRIKKENFKVTQPARGFYQYQA